MITRPSRGEMTPYLDSLSGIMNSPEPAEWAKRLWVGVLAIRPECVVPTVVASPERLRLVWPHVQVDFTGATPGRYTVLVDHQRGAEGPMPEISWFCYALDHEDGAIDLDWPLRGQWAIERVTYGPGGHNKVRA